MSRLFDPMRKDGSFPFKWTPSHCTDVRETWRKALDQQQTEAAKVRPINQQKRKA